MIATEPKRANNKKSNMEKVQKGLVRHYGTKKLLSVQEKWGKKNVGEVRQRKSEKYRSNMTVSANPFTITRGERWGRGSYPHRSPSMMGGIIFKVTKFQDYSEPTVVFYSERSNTIWYSFSYHFHKAFWQYDHRNSAVQHRQCKQAQPCAHVVAACSRGLGNVPR